MEFIDLKTQYKRLQSEIDARMRRVLEHGKFVLGPEIDELEEALARRVRVRHCITVASGTDSLEIALRALGVGFGDEVITTPFTWISTAEVIALIGAKPVFVDIDPRDFNIHVDSIESAITPRTKAIIPVSLFGQMPDYERINQIASKRGLAVIEDGAQSFGATQRPSDGPPRREAERGSPRDGLVRQSCGATLIGSTSFYPAKPLGCYGDGGALFTDDDELARKMRAIRTHGGERRNDHSLLGMNGRFDTLQAAVLLAKLPEFDWEVEQRERIGARYTSLLADAISPSSGFRGAPRVTPGNTHVYGQYTIRVADRDAVVRRLKEKGIPTAVYYPKCLHEQPVFADCGRRPGDFPESEQAAREVLSLPMHPHLTRSDQDAVVAAVREATDGAPK